METTAPMNTQLTTNLQSRQEAGWQLGEQLQSRYLDSGNNVVMALPAGGVVVGAMVARSLNCPMDVLLLEDLRHPEHTEVSVGAVSLTSRVYEMVGTATHTAQLDDQTRQLRTVLREKRSQYRVPQGVENIEGKHVILVDDGCSNEERLLQAIAMLRSEGAWGVTAVVPIATAQEISRLARLADSVCTNDVVRNKPTVRQLSYLTAEIEENEVLIWLEKGNDYRICG